MKTSVFAVLVCLLLGLAIFACGGGEDFFLRDPRVRSTAPLSAEDLIRFQSCTSDADCVVVQNGCCDCANGGEDVAIETNRVNSFNDQFDCSEIVCTTLGGSCGGGSASCDDNLCVYTP